MGSRMLYLALACLLLGPSALPLAATATGQRFAAQCARARTGTGVVRILHFGDSHLGGAEAHQEYSRFFHGSYGQGGPGLCLPWVARKPGIATQASHGWQKSGKPQGDGRTGLTGMCMETRVAGEWAQLQGKGSRLRLYLAKDPAGGKLAISIDDQPAEEIDLAGGAAQLALFDRQLPPRDGAHKLTLQSTRDGLVRILGLALEESAGAAYSPLPCNGAQISWLLAVPEALLRAQLQAESPDLILLAFGTNEANARDLNLDTYRKGLETLLTRFQQAAPQALLVLAGPPDGFLKGGAPLALDRVIAVQRASAAAFQAIFLDQRQAMGGAGAMETWFSQGLANPDRVHMTARGYQRLAHFCIDGLLTGTGQAPAQALALPFAPPMAVLPERASEPSRLYSYRNETGRVFITDDPAKVKDQPGQWIQETPR